MTRAIRVLFGAMLISFHARADLVGFVGCMVLRRSAEVVVLPDYPQSAISRGVAGIVVVQVRYGPGPTVNSVRVLDAPDQETASATVEAVKKWKFRTPPIASTKGPGEKSGRLIFYFRIVNGKPAVVDAAGEAMRTSPNPK